MDEPSVAVLIDAENASPANAAAILDEAAKYGRVAIRRMYGNWTTPQLGGWKRTLNELGIRPIQQFHFTTGKNATDSALIIDAMDLMHTGKADVFCLVSSDADFTLLASRLREDGIRVVGMGEKKTPKAFVRACDHFAYVENLADPAQAEEAHGSTDAGALDLLQRAYDKAEGPDGVAYLARIGELLTRLEPAFDTRTYGHSKLIDLVADFPAKFEIDIAEGTRNTHVVRRVDG